MHMINRFKINDSLIESVKKIMSENEKSRELEASLNEHLGIFSKKALPHEYHDAYDSILEESKKAGKLVTEKRIMAAIKNAINNKKASDKPKAKVDVPVRDQGNSPEDNMLSVKKKVNEELRSNLQDRFIKVYESSDETELQTFMESLTEEQSSLLGLNEFFGSMFDSATTPTARGSSRGADAAKRVLGTPTQPTVSVPSGDGDKTGKAPVTSGPRLPPQMHRPLPPAPGMRPGGDAARDRALPTQARPGLNPVSNNPAVNTPPPAAIVPVNNAYSPGKNADRQASVAPVSGVTDKPVATDISSVTTLAATGGQAAKPQTPKVPAITAERPAPKQARTAKPSVSPDIGGAIQNRSSVFGSDRGG